MNERHQWFADALQSLNSTFGAFAEIRGKGLLIGAELAGIYRDQSKPCWDWQPKRSDAA